jgi:NAD(P)-dependent dehydrogenase (short-subunit alcohol dehydrogenase family)
LSKLTGRVALVFGAGSSAAGLGNGKAACLAYARAGARIVAVDANPQAVAETARDVTTEGGECITFHADVRSEKDIVAAVAEAVRRFGTIDILHNNVGILRMGGPEELAVVDWDSSMEVNVRSVFLTCKHTLPIMVGRKRGVIVNISSIASVRWSGKAMVAYTASKAAINQITCEIAAQYAPDGIRCNAIIPGVIQTPMITAPYAAAHGSANELIRERSAVVPLGRLGSAWDVANAAVFLASDDASYITGALLPVDGGLSCKAY